MKRNKLKLEQKKSLEFHIKSDDYFGTLDTRITNTNEMNLPVSQKILDELAHLQANYKIVKK